MAHRQQGQAIVELALGMGALMLILAGLVAVSTVTAIELGLVAVAAVEAYPDPGGSLAALGFPHGSGADPTSANRVATSHCCSP